MVSRISGFTGRTTERRSNMNVDPITVEVVRGALMFAAEEMGIALRNSAYSPNIKERMDHSCAIFDSRRRLVAQAEHIPVHLGSMALAVQTGLSQYEGSLLDRDMLLLNDPYISGTHLPDLTMIAPVYLRDQLISYVANKAHHSDVGGRAPGSLAGDATEIYQEGIIIPPVKFVRDGEIDRDLLDIVLSNVRTPKVRMGDIRAQIAANLLGIKRVLELAAQKKGEALLGTIDAIMDFSEKRMRDEISKMPEGTYTGEDFLEDTGVTDEPAKIHVQTTVKGDRLTIDYTGTDTQVDGPVNAPLGVTLSGVYYTLISVTDSTIPINDGCYRPVTVKAPEGCLLNPLRPAPVAGGNVETSQRNVDALMKVFAQVVPTKVCAAGQGTMNNVCVGGLDPKTRQPWALYETIGGGYGGRNGLDGVDGIHVHMTNTMNTPVEAVEAFYPIRFTSYTLRPDTGGPGKWRGGCGLERSWTLLATSATLSIIAERTKIRPWGLLAGGSGALGEYLLKRQNGAVERLRAKCTVRIEQGDTVIIRTPGGGGYGPPLERDPELVLRDVKNGLVTTRSARDDYGVVINPKTFEALQKETSELRSRLTA